ncbi:Guanine nucleotide-binding protein-like 1 [Hondaea fermentalgiana]|uniref:Guanine nucleotide-binding protein-like 1 n=1 Tax=Hondaea fermentalgiana TaxID=2315210 RepID=A0A2R5G635_9STRA|nr:Guanine nucleotide-binding protein-like 1 [Hondaea fermentalgiana]|eukprot:GBG25995.1 Guanine nucleotide-binding protein-like 1 [Hondaea fermentalgiana]
MGKGKSRGARRGGAALGAALVNGKKRSRQQKRAARLAGDDDAEAETIAALGFESVAKTTKSVTETGQLEAFLADAILSGRTFEAQRASRIIDMDEEAEEDGAGGAGGNRSGAGGASELGTFDFRSLPIPRRPKWTREMTAKELAEKERESFLVWRRSIAALEASNERLQVTPFEKNLDYWRQLWRVVERSDLVVQVVDARNPLLFRCADVESFARDLSVHKSNLLLVNKADFLSDELRDAWCTYFKAKGIRFVFFSAKQEQAVLDKAKSAGSDRREEEQSAPNAEATDKSEGSSNGGAVTHSTPRMLHRMELLHLLETLAAEMRPADAEGKATLGMIGYPNVGKSSVINVIVGVTATDHSTTRVSVAATPGHTKHFQTLHLSDKTILCDCPGLVFPTFMKTKADLLCNGILPIDEIRGRDFVPAVQVVSSCLNRETFERTYAMEFPLAPTITRVPAEMLIEEFCKKRGYMGSGHDRYNEAYGARIMLKDFVRGKLCYCCPPPSLDVPASATLAGRAPVPPVGSDTGANREDLEVDDDDDNDGADFAVGSGVDATILDESLEAQLEMLELAGTDADDQLIYDETTKSDPTALKSRTKRRHGRKHRKARDPDPYGGGTFFAAKQAGKNNQGKTFTRVEHKGIAPSASK